MKIGWCKLTMLLELDFNLAKVGYCEMRVGWIRAMQKQGHTIKVLTPFTKETADTYAKLQKDADYNYGGKFPIDWIGDIEYDPKGGAADCDLLIVECAATNFMFTDKITGQPCMRRVCDILNGYKGLVVIEQSDPDLAFPFWKFARSKYDWEHKDNPYRNNTHKGKENLEDYGWATHDEIFKDKKYLVVIKSQDIEAAIKTMDGTRYGYKRLYEEGVIDVAYIGQVYDPALTGGWGFNEVPHYDLIYAGYPRNREKDFQKYMFDQPFYMQLAVIGPWHKKKYEELAEDLSLHHINNEGCVKWVEVPEFISKSKASLYLGVPRAKKLSWETSRPFEAVFCGTIVIYDDSAIYLNELFGDTFNIDQHPNIIKELCFIDIEHRRNWWAYQYERIKHRTWDRFLVELQHVVKKIGEEIPLTSHEPQEQDLTVDLITERPEIRESSEGIGKLAGDTFLKFKAKVLVEYEPFDCYGNYEADNDACVLCFWREMCIKLAGEHGVEEEQTSTDPEPGEYHFPHTEPIDWNNPPAYVKMQVGAAEITIDFDNRKVSVEFIVKDIPK